VEQGVFVAVGRPSDRVPIVPEMNNAGAREQENLIKALQRTDGRIYGAGGAAELLGINPTTLASRLRALKIDVAKAR
jgi:formate hydrogenlyase transcriptional activator